MQCPKCKKTDRITLIGFDFLMYVNSNDEKQAEASDYFLENELTANAKCWHCGLQFPVKAELNWKTDYVYKPDLNFKEKTIREIDYYDFERFVQECYGGDFEFVAVQEANNNSQYEFTAGEGNMVMENKNTEEMIRQGNYPTHCVNHLFKCLYEDGFIKAGQYIIKVSW